jgi:hypothetical protein
MKVKELIQALSNFDPDIMVVVTGYENGFEKLEEVTEVNISRNPYADKNGKLPWWDGEFDLAKEGDKESFPAVLLPRNCYSKYKN